MQCIIHSKDFILALYQACLNNDSIRSKNCTTSKFFKLIKEYNSASGSIAPSDFKSYFGSKHILFSGYQQHDSQEFCRVLLEDISMDLNRVKVKPKYEELKTENKNKLELNKDYHSLFQKRENSIVVDFFYGQLCNIFSCLECKLETYSYEKFLDIPILLSIIYNLYTHDIDSNNEYSNLEITGLLKNHFKEEDIMWGVKCEKCSKKSMHRKKCRISMLPEFLIISFQRYDFRTNRKMNSSIRFCESLDISQFTDLDCLGKFHL